LSFEEAILTVPTRRVPIKNAINKKSYPDYQERARTKPISDLQSKAAGDGQIQGVHHRDLFQVKHFTTDRVESPGEPLAPTCRHDPPFCQDEGRNKGTGKPDVILFQTQKLKGFFVFPLCSLLPSVVIKMGWQLPENLFFNHRGHRGHRVF
jgi:hypothetical protein